MAFVWAGTRGLRGYVIAMTGLSAAIAVYEAQLTVTDAALQASTLLFDALSSSALAEDRALDRHWRNARTVASHNPRVYKARLVGDWHLNGADPSAAFTPSP